LYSSQERLLVVTYYNPYSPLKEHATGPIALLTPAAAAAAAARKREEAAAAASQGTVAGKAIHR